ncbi:uncharacterized protein E0L32_011335 [Thyridium curvatum]|uniref:Heterokaryon incompatibility domain-containing protein n=1 Tax=Thyridium curvatum TaxID=1093900 RepID=A0A507B9E1_9PEZI|nr:uncharacterized protein E0L32_011335 [Thyridium curvatum]TPX18942.1 hypothetical protein E0L32_011335 [Thyridium curvatum]
MSDQALDHADQQAATAPSRSSLTPEELEAMRKMHDFFREANRMCEEQQPPKFSYLRLRLDWIRLIDLQPGSEDDPIVCALSMQPLQELPADEYEAVSYVWGENLHKETITCNWRIPVITADWQIAFAAPKTITNNFSVTSNVLGLLKGLRYTDRPRRLWIDQICIDQEDEAEKAEQIKIMTDIYAGATRVLIWLGDGADISEEDTEDIFAAIDLYANLSELSEAAIFSFFSWVITGETIDVYDMQEEDEEGHSTRTHHGIWRQIFRKLQPTLAILNDPVADAVVSRGEYRRDLAMTQIFRQGPSHPQFKETIEQAQIADTYERLKKWRLKRLLPELRSAGATEPKDKVLALTGFAHDDGRKIELPNLPHQVSLLYLTVVKYWMTTPDDNLYILYSRITSQYSFDVAQTPERLEGDANDSFWAYVKKMETTAAGDGTVSRGVPPDKYTPENLREARRAQFSKAKGRERAFYAGRTMFTSSNGLIGLSPAHAAVGDSVIIIAGAHVPFVVSKRPDNYYEIKGECLVYGIMHGEVMQDVPNGKIKELTLV